MSDPEKQSRDVIMVTIAWAQFLAMAAVIDKADMRNLRSAGERVLSSPLAMAVGLDESWRGGRRSMF
jgi:hypothetical protein